MSISAIGGASAYQGMRAAIQASRPAPGGETAPARSPAAAQAATPVNDVPKPGREDRVTLSSSAVRSAGAYESLRNTSRVIRNDHVAAAPSTQGPSTVERIQQDTQVAAQADTQDRGGQMASRIHVVA